MKQWFRIVLQGLSTICNALCVWMSEWLNTLLSRRILALLWLPGFDSYHKVRSWSKGSRFVSTETTCKSQVMSLVTPDCSGYYEALNGCPHFGQHYSVIACRQNLPSALLRMFQSYSVYMNNTVLSYKAPNKYLLRSAVQSHNFPIASAKLPPKNFPNPWRKYSISRYFIVSL
jgi:hypothetical protein